MAVTRYPMPSTQMPVVDPKTGRMTVAWVNYFKGLQDVANRVTAFQDEVAGGAALGDVITAFNALTAALQTASLQETS